MRTISTLAVLSALVAAGTSHADPRPPKAWVQVFNDTKDPICKVELSGQIVFDGRINAGGTKRLEVTSGAYDLIVMRCKEPLARPMKIAIGARHEIIIHQGAKPTRKPARGFGATWFRVSDVGPPPPLPPRR